MEHTKKARRKPEIVEAVRWTPGVEVPDLTELQAEIHHSDDGTLYYVSRPGCRAHNWMSVATVIEPNEADKTAAGGFFGPALAQFKTDDGRTYWRRVFPFVTFKVKSGAVAPADQTGDLFLDFAAMERWPEEATATAVLFRGTSDAQVVNCGDWIVTHPCGKRVVMREAQFEAEFDVEV